MPRLKAPERREQLMAVATTLFSQRGYDATTTAAIAEAAGITEPVLYRHFESKKDLFIAVLRNCTERLIRYWQEAASGSATATDQIRELARSVYESLPEISDAQRLVYGAAATGVDPDMREVLKAHALHFHAMAKRIIDRGRAGGEFRTDLDPDAMGWALVNVYTGFSFTRLNFQSPPVMDLRVGVELIVTGLLKPGARPAKASEAQ